MSWRVVTICDVWRLGQDHLIQLVIQAQGQSVAPYTGNEFSFSTRRRPETVSGIAVRLDWILDK